MHVQESYSTFTVSYLDVSHKYNPPLVFVQSCQVHSHKTKDFALGEQQHLCPNISIATLAKISSLAEGVAISLVHHYIIGCGT